MSSWPEPPELRRCALAVAVLHDLDMVPAINGLVLTGSTPVEVSWDECRRALGGLPPESDDGRHRLARWLRLRRWLAGRTVDELLDRTRPYGVPVRSALHPGLDWVRRRVLGDAVDLGLGLVGVDAETPDAVVPAPERLLLQTGLDTDACWPAAVSYLEEMGQRAAERMERMPDAPLRPMGDCDVLTLLGARAMRDAIADGVADGMRTVAVPVRSRGWLDLSRVDPAFTATAANITSIEERGFGRPLLVTREEVAEAAEGGDVIRLAVEDRIAPVIDLRDVMYHRL
jgi:hypothetical protein